MKRRELFQQAAFAGAAIAMERVAQAAGEITLYLDPVKGADANAGTKAAPLKTLAAAAARVNKLQEPGAVTLVLDEGIYGVNETAVGRRGCSQDRRRALYEDCCVSGRGDQETEYNREQEMSMTTIRTRTIACAVAMTAVLSLTPLRAQTTQAALSKEAGTLSDKFTGLARVMAGKYDWKPAQGVRSAGDVLNLIVMENGMLLGTLTGAGGGRGGGRGAPVTDPEKLQEALKTSYANLQKAIDGLSDADLKAPVKMFGRDMTKEDAVRFLFGDQHEHLGQSIAYARSNGVVPPWSK